MRYRYAMSEQEAKALYLRGKYVHSHKGKYKRRHRRSLVVGVMILSELIFPTTVVIPE